MRGAVLQERHGNPMGQEQAILPVQMLHLYSGLLNDISVEET
jgi:hypothetical protein